MKHFKELNFSFFVNFFTTNFAHICISINNLTVSSYAVKIVIFGDFKSCRIIFDQCILWECIINNLLYVNLDFTSYLLRFSTWDPIFIDETIDVVHIWNWSFHCHLRFYKWKGKNVDIFAMNLLVCFNNFSCNFVIFNQQSAKFGESCKFICKSYIRVYFKVLNKVSIYALDLGLLKPL